MRHRSVVVVSLVAVTALSIVAVASAHKEVFKSHVKIESDVPFHGVVISARPACVPGRTVKLIQEKPNANEVVGKTTTAEDGSWSITEGVNDQHPAYAVVSKTFLKDDDRHRHICRADRSKTIGISEDTGAG